MPIVKDNRRSTFKGNPQGVNSGVCVVPRLGEEGDTLRASFSSIARSGEYQKVK